MKTKLLLSFCVVFLLSLSSHAYAQFKVKKEVDSSIRNTRKVSKANANNANKLVYTFCSDEINNAARVDQDVELRAYLRIPAKQWKGCKITCVEFGFAYEVGKDSYMFVSKDLNADPLVKQYYQCDTIAIPDEGYIGWKNVPFDEPYLIDSDDDLYVGVYTIQQDPWGTFGLDNLAPIPGANLVSYRRPGKAEWVYQELPSNLSIKVIIEGENIPQTHMRIYSHSSDKMYYKIGESVAINGTIINEGVKPVESFDISYQLNDNESVTTHVSDVTIQPMEIYDFNFDTTVSKEGRGNLILTVSNPNGEPDDFQGSTSVTYDKFACMAKGIQKNVLVEEIVGTDDEGAVTAAEIIKEAIDNSDKKDNIIWVQNHVLADDEYTIEGYSNYSMLYASAIFTPAVNLNHKEAISGTFMLNEENEKVPATSELFLIDNDFGKHLNSILEDDVFYSLNAECDVIDDDVLKIKVALKPAIEGLFPSIFGPNLAMLLTEDNIVGRQAGVDGDYVHNGIPRTFINSEDPRFGMVGNKIEISDNGYTLETKYIIPDKSWKLENMNLICYIMDARMMIDNVVSCPVKANPDGLKKETAENDFTINCKDGTLLIDGDFDQARILSISGQTVMETNNANINVSKLNKGIYCILIQKGNRFVSKKFIIQ